MEREKEISSLFEKSAKAIADKHYSEIELATSLNGKRPPFDELMARLKELEKDLTQNAVKIIEIYKQKEGQYVNNLTDNCQQTVRITIEDFVKKL